ncbi:hypothetical protein [Streptomyces sp. NBC_01236]|uniref:hypothetical protein n=1 Tax=Streptomyces sp. NBC_01236 TaxID=2903789 RepID=UPI002E142253|nr:hypothetical protein OG324_45020 [Streptomyces sp. NBC_01236]
MATNPFPRRLAASPPRTPAADWSKEHLGRHTYPRRVESTDALPLGPSIKVVKRDLWACYGS